MQPRARGPPRGGRTDPRTCERKTVGRIVGQTAALKTRTPGGTRTRPEGREVAMNR